MNDEHFLKKNQDVVEENKYTFVREMLSEFPEKILQQTNRAAKNKPRFNLPRDCKP